MKMSVKNFKSVFKLSLASLIKTISDKLCDRLALYVKFSNILRKILGLLCSVVDPDPDSATSLDPDPDSNPDPGNSKRWIKCGPNDVFHGIF